jgi:hypothetical protein
MSGQIAACHGKASLIVKLCCTRDTKPGDPIGKRYIKIIGQLLDPYLAKFGCQIRSKKRLLLKRSSPAGSHGMSFCGLAGRQRSANATDFCNMRRARLPI